MPRTVERHKIAGTTEQTKDAERRALNELLTFLGVDDCLPDYITEARAVAFVDHLNDGTLSFATKKGRLSCLARLWGMRKVRAQLPANRANIWHGHDLKGEPTCSSPSAMGTLQVIRTWAERIRRDAIALWFAKSHPRTPWGAKALGVVVVAYALSPIDLIPDFIPILGYLDDLLLLPALMWLVVRMLPTDVLLECRQQAEEWTARAARKPRSMAGGVLIVAIWVTIGSLALWWLIAMLSA